jgi:colicin import membrane protein
MNFEEGAVLSSTDGVSYNSPCNWRTARAHAYTHTNCILTDTVVCTAHACGAIAEEVEVKRTTEEEATAARVKRMAGQKSLAEQLADAKEKAQNEWKEKNNPFRAPKALDEEDVQFLSEHETAVKAQATRIKLQDESDLIQFKTAVAERTLQAAADEAAAEKAAAAAAAAAAPTKPSAAAAAASAAAPAESDGAGGGDADGDAAMPNAPIVIVKSKHKHKSKRKNAADAANGAAAGKAAPSKSTAAAAAPVTATATVGSEKSASAAKSADENAAKRQKTSAGDAAPAKPPAALGLLGAYADDEDEFE